MFFLHERKIEITENNYFGKQRLIEEYKDLIKEYCSFNDRSRYYKYILQT